MDGGEMGKQGGQGLKPLRESAVAAGLKPCPDEKNSWRAEARLYETIAGWTFWRDQLKRAFWTLPSGFTFQG